MLYLTRQEFGAVRAGACCGSWSSRVVFEQTWAKKTHTEGRQLHVGVWRGEKASFAVETGTCTPLLSNSGPAAGFILAQAIHGDDTKQLLLL